MKYVFTELQELLYVFSLSSTSIFMVRPTFDKNHIVYKRHRNVVKHVVHVAVT